MWRSKWIFESEILEQCRRPSTCPDLVIWRYPLSLSSIRALLALRGRGIPTMRVVTMFEDPLGDGWKRLVKQRVFPVPFNYLDCVVVSSGRMRDNLKSLGVETRIEVLPHGVDLKRFHPIETSPGAAPIRPKLGLRSDAEVVLFVGPIVARKGVDYLAAAWDRIAGDRPRAHLLLVGPQPKGDAGDQPSFFEEVRGTLARGRGADRVTFVGPVPDVAQYMRAADVFVLASHREGMPNVVLEAFACGVATVLTPFRGLPEELGCPGEQYVLVNHDVREVGEAVSGLLADKTRRREVGGSALEWAREQLDVEKSLDRLAELCQDLAGSRPAFRMNRKDRPKGGGQRET